MKPVANLVIEMAANVARLEKDMAMARRSVDTAMQKIQRSAQMAMRALGALGLGLGAAQMAGFVRQAINVGDQMVKTAQQIGVATEQVAGLQLAFRQGGGSAAEMEMAVGRLVNGMNKQTDVFKKLNLQSKDTFGALSEIADIFQKMPDGAQKSALAYELFGRSGLRLIPILNQGSEGLQNYISLADKLGMTVSSEVGKQFEVFNDTLDTVSAAMEGLANQAAIALIPTLQSLADTLLSAFTSGAVQRGVENLIEAFKLLGIAIAGRLIASIAAMTASLVGLTASLTAGTAAVGGFTAALTGLKGIAALLGGSVGVIATVAGGLAYFSEQAYRAETTAEGLAEKLNITNAELRTMTQLQVEQKIVQVASELQKLEVQAIETAAAMAILNDQSSDPEAYSFAGGELSNELGTTNKKIAAFQELLETLKNRLVETNKASNQAADAFSNFGKSAENAEDKVRNLIRAYTDETDMMTMSNREKEYFLFLNKMEAEGIQGNTELWKELAKVYREAQADRTSVEATIKQQDADKKRLEDRIEAEKEFAKQAEQINNQIGQSLTDALVEGGVNAKDFLIKMFRTLILRPLIQPIISGVLGAMGVGSAGAALAGGTGGDAMSQAVGLSGIVSSLKGAVDMVTGGFAALGTSVSNLAVDAGFELMSMGFQDAGFAMIDASAALGTAASYLAGIGAGLGIGNMVSGQFSVGGSSWLSTGIGTAIGAAFGPLGAAIGGTLGGVINRAFGMGGTTTEAVGITGRMTTEGALAEQYTITKQKGGWFRGDTIRTAYAALEKDIADRFAMTAKTIGQSVISMADSLGLSADRLDGFSRSFMLDFKGMSEEQINAKIEKEFGRFADALVETLGSGVESFTRGTETISQTLSRLATNLATVNQTFDILGFTLYEGSLAGADAAQKMVDLFGGIENFTAVTSFYYENFYTEQERANKQLEQMTKLFDILGYELPYTRDGFKALVEAAQAAGDDAMVASLLQIAPQFDSLRTALDNLSETAAETTKDLVQIANERYALETKILTLNNNTSMLRERELENVDESNRTLQQNIWAVEDAIEANNRLNSTLSEFAGLESKLFSLIDDTNSLRERELKSLDPSNRELQKHIWALEDAKEAYAAINSVLQEARTIENQILQLTGNTTELRKRELEAIAPANRELQKHLWAIEDAKQAYEDSVSATKDAINDLERAIANEVDKIKETIDNRLAYSLNRAETAFNKFSEAIDDKITSINDAVSLLNSTASATDYAFNKAVEALQAERDAKAEAYRKEYDDLVASLNEQSNIKNEIVNVRNQSIDNLKSIFDALQNGIDTLTNATLPNESIGAALTFIDESLRIARSGGGVPDQEMLSKSIALATSRGTESFNSAFEMRRSNLILRNNLIELQDITSGSLSIEEMQLEATTEQVDLLKTQIEDAQKQFEIDLQSNEQYYSAQILLLREQIDASRNIDTSILSVKDAIDLMQLALVDEQRATRNLQQLIGDESNVNQQALIDLSDTTIKNLSLQLEQAKQNYDDEVDRLTKFYDAQLKSQINQLNTSVAIRLGINNIGSGILSLSNGVLTVNTATTSVANAVKNLTDLTASTGLNNAKLLELINTSIGSSSSQNAGDAAAAVKVAQDAALALATNQFMLNEALKSASDAALAAANAAAAAALAASKTKEDPFLMTSFQKDIDILYRQILDRPADVSGLQFWSGSGMSLSDIQVELYKSPEYRRLQIDKMYQDIFNRPADAAGLTFWMSSGLGLDAVRQELLREKATGAFADGGLAPAGMALVGEEGPELVNFARPAMVYTAGETAEILNGGSSSQETATEIRYLREENKAQSRSLVALQARMTRLLERWDGDGLPEERVVTA